MAEIDGLWPIALIEDRYSGVYSGGRWLAIANANAEIERDGSRIQNVLFGDAYADDISAAGFWVETPEWIAVGNTPDEALDALRAKHPST